MKILVIGDSCLDVFNYCKINRICPEAPVPVLTPAHTTTNSGMAGNVAKNLISMSAEVNLITNTSSIRKIRYIDNKSGQMIMRLDENDTCERISIGDIETDYSQYDAVVISDYDKGFLELDDINHIAKVAGDIPIFLDTKKPIQLNLFNRNIDYIKINKDEWLLLPKDDDSDDMYFSLIVTCGPEGALYNGRKYPVDKPVPVSNVSGAGDTFLAGLVYEFVKSNDIEEAIKFSNECASKVIQERGVTTI